MTVRTHSVDETGQRYALEVSPTASFIVYSDVRLNRYLRHVPVVYIQIHSTEHAPRRDHVSFAVRFGPPHSTFDVTRGGH